MYRARLHVDVAGRPADPGPKQPLRLGCVARAKCCPHLLRTESFGKVEIHAVEISKVLGLRDSRWGIDYKGRRAGAALLFGEAQLPVSVLTFASARGVQPPLICAKLKLYPYFLVEN